MAHTIRHPLTRNRVYSVENDGRVRVQADNTDETGDRWGHFDNSGRWLGGELLHADPQMCRHMFAHWQLTQADVKGGADD
ncbi:conserved hypothetical protein [Frankia canadensis]|uniref:Transposase n=1 Tax=Frankia canadensis TaxID=1836972 RepID=A0A2I2KJG6_9ACTN|nr:hypothetical protein [Frankia canadensis]SNQ45800.1 conserved hypothetical protein [Frankia canadensis]SOU53090.1 conserved hypothetical protein [Frankia canadensis]